MAYDWEENGVVLSAPYCDIADRVTELLEAELKRAHTEAKAAFNREAEAIERYTVKNLYVRLGFEADELCIFIQEEYDLCSKTVSLKSLIREIADYDNADEWMPRVSKALCDLVA